MTDADVIAALSPAQRVGLTVWAEARGSTPALRHGIASVIANRVTAHRPRWGLTADAVCLRPSQFSCWNPGGTDPNHRTLLATAQRLLQLDVVGPILIECLALAAAVCAGTLSDTVHGATFYYSPAAMVPRGRVPAWAVGHKPVAVIDTTRFFAGIA